MKILYTCLVLFWNWQCNIGFQETLSLKRFEKLTRYFHLNDNTTQGARGTPEFDRLHKIRPVLDETRRTFRSQMNPPKQQAIDEGMVKYKGRFFARQYMPNKPVKRGFKIFMRCDEDGYCYDYWPYMGKHDFFHGKSLGERVVKHLCRPLKYKGHHVFFDRFFTSISLVRTLLQNGIFSCGTIKSDSEGFPPELRNPDLRRGETLQMQHDQLLATAWKDKKTVHILSTNCSPFGDGPVVRRTRGGNFVEVMCPPPVSSYQRYMSGVDRCMQHRAKNPVGRPSKKYWKFFFNFIMEVCLINAFEIFSRTNGKDLPAKTRFDLLDFRMEVAQQLIGGFRGRKRGHHLQGILDPPHVFCHLDRLKSTCKWCTKHGEKKRKETVYGCKGCNKHLCSERCFREFHSDVNL